MEKKKFLVNVYSLILGCYTFIIGIITSLLVGGSLTTLRMYGSLSRAIIDVMFSMVLAVFIITKRRYDMKKLILFIAIVISFIISGYITRRVHIMTYALLIIAAKNCKSCNSAIKAALIGTAFSGAIVLVLSQIGYIPDIKMIRHSSYAYYSMFYSNVAHCFGYSYYHHIPYKLYFIMLGVMKVKKKKMTWPEILMWATVNFIVFYFTTLRLTFYLGFFSLMLYIILIKFDLFKINNKKIKSIMTLSFPLMFVGANLFYYFYNINNTVYAQLDLLTSGRLQLGREAFERYPINLFGNMIETSAASSTTRYFFIDSGYVYALLGYGVLFSIIVVIMYSCLCRFACERNDKALLIWLISVLIFTISNDVWADLSMNPILVIFPIMWNQSTKERTVKHRLSGTYYLEH